MSDPISSFDTRVFQAESPEDFVFRDVDEATARASESYCICFSKDGTDVEHHVFALGRRLRHDYFERKYPDNALIQAHRARWSNVPFDVVELSPDGTIETRYRHNADGVFELKTVFELNALKDPISQTMFAPDGTIVERQEYEYDDDGEICRTRVLAGDGTVLADDEA